MKSLLTTTALTLFVGTAAFAQSTSVDAEAGTDLSAQAGDQAITAEGGAAADAEADTDLMDDAGNALAETGDAIEDGAEATGNAIAEAGDEIQDGANELFANLNANVSSPKIQAGEYVSAKTEMMTLADLEGTVVYDINDEEVGEISEIMLSSTGVADKAVIDVGGFIGIGEKSVAVPFSEIALMVPADQLDAEAGTDTELGMDAEADAANADVDAAAEMNARVVAYVDSTQEELEALPEVEE